MARKPPHKTPQPKTYPKATRKKAKGMYDAGVGFAEISRRLGVAKSTLVRWSKEDSWRELKLVAEVPAEIKLPKAKAVRVKPETPRSQPPVDELAPRRQRKSLAESVRTARETLADAITTAADRQAFQALGPMATGLCRLAELELKLNPVSAKELVARAIELELGPDEFLNTLAEEWELRA